MDIFDNIIRLVVVGRGVGRVIDKSDVEVRGQIQDDGRTLKIFYNPVLTSTQAELLRAIHEERGGPLLTCDLCYDDFECGTGDEIVIAIQADEKGWQYCKGDVICPKCK